MSEDKRAQFLETLTSEQFRKRLEKAHCFEQLGGAGMLKKIQRIFLTPGIYLPYLFYAKACMHRWSLSTITLFWGRKIKIPLQDYDSLALHMFGFAGGKEAELKLAKFLIKNLSQSDVFYDIGANCGFYTYLASEFDRETHTFEPISELAHVIEGNVRENKNVTVNSMALSDKNGNIDFYVMNSTGLSTINTVVAESYTPRVDNAFKFKKVTVPTMTLDEYVKNHAKPTFLKIDAEGAEEVIIKGGQNFFSSHGPMIAMEIWGKENESGLSMGAATKLREMGYQSFRINSEGVLEKVDGNLSDEAPPTGGDNFIFKK